MATVTYTLHRNQKPTEAQREMVRKAGEKQDKLLAEGRDDEVFDEDSEPMDEETNPEGYRAMIDAVIKRNRRLEELAKKQA